MNPTYLLVCPVIKSGTSLDGQKDKNDFVNLLPCLLFKPSLLLFYQLDIEKIFKEEEKRRKLDYIFSVLSFYALAVHIRVSIFSTFLLGAIIRGYYLI